MSLGALCSLGVIAYVLNNPLKYTDPSGHCPACIFGAALGALYVGGRFSWEVSTMLVPGADRASRDQVGGQLVIQLSQVIESEARQQYADATVIKAILRHESAAFERRLFTPLPNQVPDIGANIAESMQVLAQGDTASIGPGQMQLRTARQLEQLGYVTRRGSDAATVISLLDNRSAVEYVAGMVHYLSDQLHTVEGFAALRPQEQQRLLLIGYNQGWGLLKDNIEELGLQGVIDKYQYDNQTLDEYLRWVQSQSQ